MDTHNARNILPFCFAAGYRVFGDLFCDWSAARLVVVRPSAAIPHFWGATGWRGSLPDNALVLDDARSRSHLNCGAWKTDSLDTNGGLRPGVGRFPYRSKMSSL